jgi:Coenzyme PQQ synthesis protein D (PqqD)
MSHPHDPADGHTIARADGLVASHLGAEVVILNIESGFFFHLNKTGAGVWDLLEMPLSLETICGTLSRRFAVDPVECRRDVTEFVDAMLAKGLLTRA